MKKAAVDIVRDYTGSEDGIQMLGKYDSVVLSSLALLLAEKKVNFFNPILRSSVLFYGAAVSVLVILIKGVLTKKGI